MTDLDRLPGYREMLCTHARHIAGGDFEVDVHGVAGTTYPDGFAPVRFVEMQSKLRRAGALSVSRHGIYAKPPRALMDHLHVLTGRQFTAAGEVSRPVIVGKAREGWDQ